jgi:hypothetical protein
MTERMIMKSSVEEGFDGQGQGVRTAIGKEMKRR